MEGENGEKTWVTLKTYTHYEGAVSTTLRKTWLKSQVFSALQNASWVVTVWILGRTSFQRAWMDARLGYKDPT